MVNAEIILLSAPGEHGVMAEEGGYAAGEGSQPSQAGSESGSTREREGCGANASERNEAEPSVGGDPNGATRWLGHAELPEPDHAAGELNTKSRDEELEHSECDGHHNPNTGSDKDSNERALGEVNEHREVVGAGYADLCVSCDNRTDELRLLGNGVVPATAELAFRTLWEELTNE
jgi:hypothetical protein